MGGRSAHSITSPSRGPAALRACGQGHWVQPGGPQHRAGAVQYSGARITGQGPYGTLGPAAQGRGRMVFWCPQHMARGRTVLWGPQHRAGAIQYSGARSTGQGQFGTLGPQHRAGAARDSGSLWDGCVHRRASTCYGEATLLALCLLKVNSSYKMIRKRSKLFQLSFCQEIILVMGEHKT